MLRREFIITNIPGVEARSAKFRLCSSTGESIMKESHLIIYSKEGRKEKMRERDSTKFRCLN